MKLHLFAKTGENEAFRISRTASFLRILTTAGSGVLAAMAFPPCNAEILAFAALAPLIALASTQSWRKAALSGWLWGVGWAFCAFFWLREIFIAIPFAIAPILALWSALFAAGIPFLFRYLLHPAEVVAKGYSAMQKYQSGFLRQLFFALAVAAWWCCVDFLRVELFPWNYLAVSQYKNPALLQIAEYTGSFGVTFLLVFVNAALALALRLAPREMAGGHYPKARVFLCAILLTAACGVFGIWRIRQIQTAPVAGRQVRIGLIQGDIAQDPEVRDGGAEEALATYLLLTSKLLKKESCELIVWPETAVSCPIFGGSHLSAFYRNEVKHLLQTYRTPMLVGTLHFVRFADGSFGETNTALFFSGDARILRHDKVHRVPFGEFIPFRKYLPEWLVRRIDMQRDLTPGVEPAVMPVAPQTRAGIAICYESIFADLARREALRGANLFIVLSNDAWYPESSEPEQHLANAVIRSIETRIPSLRSGNNGGTLVVGRTGIVEKTFPTGITGRGQAAGILTVTPETNPVPTFHTRYGEVFLFLCALFAAAAYFAALLQCRKVGRAMNDGFDRKNP